MFSSILIVDDEPSNRKALARILHQKFSQIFEAGNGREALEKLKGIHYDLILLDIMMPEMDGIEFLEHYAKLGLKTPVIVCSANTDISRVVEAMKLGATDYIEKPIESNLLLRRIRSIEETQILKRENAELLQKVKQGRFTRLLGNSPAMQKVMVSVERLANSKSTILIYGESGTGKELVAKSLHELSERKEEPFVVVDCAAVHANTIESELFGHEKGAFTGADQRREGLLIAARGGTVFMDEIGELPLDLQAKLLRVLQEYQVRALGSTLYKNINARIVAATNRDLLAEVKAGRFREDLYYRLSIIKLDIPPLRERTGDIELLISHFLNKYNEDYGVKEFSDEVLRTLVMYAWPGNVRQLENTVHRAMALAAEEQQELGMELLPSDIAQASPYHSEIFSTKNLPLLTMREIEQIAIENALRYTEGNRRQAAEILGIGEATLYRKIKS
ncbi:MAG: sigma-54-dependent Fis family transcriptional regulator [Fibrobacter sp.]|nr:sigma-54-dependent Fis family transcriptional regulator [Fibrobacter sp.]